MSAWWRLGARFAFPIGPTLTPRLPSLRRGGTLPANAPGSIDPSRWPLSKRAGLKGRSEMSTPARTREPDYWQNVATPPVPPHWFVGTRAEKGKRSVGRLSGQQRGWITAGVGGDRV